MRELGAAVHDRVRGALNLLARAAPARCAAPFTELVDALAPQVCPLCRAQRGACECEDFRGLTSASIADGEAVGRCSICATRVPAPLTGRACRLCREDPPPFVSTAALFDYRSAGLRDWVLRFKHGGRPDLAEELGLRLAQVVVEHGRFFCDVEAWSSSDDAHACVVPIPLHPLRRLERGYDQAWLLARALAEFLDLGAHRALVRTRATRPQGGLSAESRRANVRGAFEVGARHAARIDGSVVLLVDDVLASGGTARAAARALLDGGARRVHLAVAGRS